MTMLATPATMSQGSGLGQGPRLMVPKAVASQHIRAHIQRGMAIRRQRIRYIEDLEDVRALKGEWVQSYTETLKQLFSSTDIADECNDWVGKVYPEFSDVSLFVEQFYEEMDYRTEKLRNVLKRLEDLGEYIPRTITAAPPPVTTMSEPEPAPAPAPAPVAVMQTPVAPIPSPVAAPAPTVTVTFSTPAPAPAPAPAPSKTAAPAATKATPVAKAAPVAAPPAMTPRTSPAAEAEIAVSTGPDVAPPLNTGIFIVHGDLQPTVNTINAFMDDLGIQLQALPTHPEKGKGLVSSLEKNPDASFALVLLGHDDAVALRRSAADASAGVRSGIVFELGYLVGRLGLKRVCVLYTGGTETFVSDHGIQFLPIDSGNGWQLHMARHLKRAGIEIDLNKLF